MESIVSKTLDNIDIQILNLLQTQAQLSNIELAKRVNLSPPAIHSRIKRLEKDGFIKRQVAILDQEKLGFDLSCFIFISMNIHQGDKFEFLENSIKEMPEVLECHCLTGEYDYLLKIVSKNRNDLEAFTRKLYKLGITRIQTSLVLREIKNSTVLPI
ncbi:Lrp/AsnC family transcriptional regulator [Niallia sp. 03133]|uniref:Lrp/AsnC family transcriptional regulator n=1 Tax=Niallia sp. 03133 TaxID=3458060 RepID=UPI004043FAB5